MKKQISFLLMMVLPGLICKGFASLSGEMTFEKPAIPRTYTWKGASGASWTAPSSWNPQRTSPSMWDILLFNSGHEFTVTGVPDETIGQLKVSDQTRVTFLSGGNRTLIIAGLDGDDLTVDAGSHLTLSGSNAIRILLDHEATGSISGTIHLAEGEHRIESRAENGLVFQPGSTFIAENGFAGNPFGCTSLNSVIFGSSSTFICKAGDHPFGAPAPKSVVIFREGSRYVHLSKEPASLGDRIYGGFELDHPDADILADGSNLLITGDLVVIRGKLMLSTRDNIEIRGNLAVYAPGSLVFRPEGESRVTLNGSSTQSISGDGVLEISGNVQFIFSNAVNVSRDLTFQGALKIINGGMLSIRPGGTVTVHRSLNNEVTEGIVIRSGENGTGSLITLGPIEGQGSGRVECYLRPGMWHYVSSPVESARAVSFSGDYVKTSDPTSTTGWGPWITNPLYLLEPLCGYAVWKPLSNQIPECFSGHLNSGDMSIMRNRNENDPYAGWHLLGNPYPSSLDLSSRSVKWEEFEPAAWFWDQGGPGSTGNYLVYPALLGLPPGTGFHSGLVPPMQGFFAHIDSNYSGKTIFSVNNEARVHGNELFLKSGQQALERSLALKVISKENGYSDRIFIHFSPDYTDQYDAGYDAWKLNGLADAPQLYSLTPNGQKLSFHCLPFKDPQVSLPVGFSCDKPGIFRLEASFMKTFPDEISIFLEDRLAKSMQDLRDQPEYSFQSEPSNDPMRFLVHFRDAGSVLTEKESLSGIRIFSGGKSIFVQTTAIVPEVELTVFDMMGRKMGYYKTGGSPLIQVPVNYPEGCYVVRAVTRDGVKVCKVVL